ncbi:unnamed protein product, partial [Amoebophrya sp. A25]
VAGVSFVDHAASGGSVGFGDNYVDFVKPVPNKERRPSSSGSSSSTSKPERQIRINIVAKPGPHSILLRCAFQHAAD